MKVRCIQGGEGGVGPLKGQVYSVIRETLDYYYIGLRYDGWGKFRFEIVVGCPCNVSECVAHKKV